MTRRIFFLLLFLLVPAAIAAAQRPARFAAKLRDGSLVEGDVLANWHTADAVPTLDGRSLLEANNPMLWLRDRQLTAADPPEAFIELFSGDRLPGVALEHCGPASGSPEQVFSHWRVRPAMTQRRPQSLDEPLVRVRAQSIRRIVWQRRPSPRYRPGTVFLRDGSSLPFRSARFEGDQALLLLPTGTRRVSLADMAELHLPARDFWQDYLDELAVLSPNPDGRLLQLETDDGLIATTSLDRFTVFAWGGSEHWQNWAHGVQPAWALDILFIPSANVVIRRMFAPQDVLLSRVPSLEADGGGMPMTSAWPPQVNRNVLGGTLHSGGREFGWGFGVQAFSQLRFPLTPLASVLRVDLGLDRTVGTGGCIQGIIRSGGSASPPIFESGVLVGSSHVQASGRIELSVPSEAPGELVLVVDPAHEKRPPGADPLNIRDCANWLEPTLELNPDRLRDELRRRATGQVPAWNDWAVAVGSDATWPSVLREFPGRPSTFLRCVSSSKEPLVLGRRLKLDPRTPWLLLSVGQDRAPQGRPRVQVLLDGEMVLDDEIPFSDKWRSDVNPLIVPLRDYLSAGPRDVQAEIRQIPGEQETPVYWAGILAVERLPMIHELFEDDGHFVASQGPPTGGRVPTSATQPPGEQDSTPREPAAAATLVTEDKQSGIRSVRLAAGPQYQLDLRGSLAIRERPAWGEFRFLRFAFRKQGAGRICLQLDHRQTQERPARYDAGTGEPCFPLARRVRDETLADAWTVITRDVFADFGPLDIEGLTLSAPDGQCVWFDQIYLARAVDDFRFLPEPATRTPADEQAAAMAAIQQRVLAAAVTIDFGEGRIGAGTVISGEGDVLTAGHLMIAPNRAVRATLADGRTVEAVTKGICRDLDAGLVKITVPGPFPAVEIENFSQLDTRGFYCAVSPRGEPAVDGSPFVSAVHVRRLVGVQLWTDEASPGGLPGSGLLNRWGKLVGIHAGRSSFGGVIYGVLPNAQNLLGRLRSDEVWGRWLRAATPATGIVLATSPDGLKVHAVAAGSTAASSDLQAGDIITQIDGKPAQMPDDLYQAIAEKDPGATIRIEFRRGSGGGTINIGLSPHTP